jgi:hypothetical protein
VDDFNEVAARPMQAEAAAGNPKDAFKVIEMTGEFREKLGQTAPAPPKSPRLR